MKKPITALILICLFLNLGCVNYLTPVKGSKELVENDYNVSNFNSVDLSHAFNVELIQSEDYKVIVEHNTNLTEYINVEVHDKTLVVGLLSNHSYNNTKLSAVIYLPKLERIEASGACSINIPEFKTQNLEIDISGATDITGKIELNNNLEIKASGASDIKLSGIVKHAVVDLSGATSLSGKNLEVEEDLKIEGSGASSIALMSNGTMDVDLSGASSLNYYGSGVIVNSDLSGASSIRKR